MGTLYTKMTVPEDDFGLVHGLPTPSSTPIKHLSRRQSMEAPKFPVETPTSPKLSTSRTISGTGHKVIGILTPQTSPIKRENTRSEKSRSSMSSGADFIGHPITPTRLSVSSDENEMPFTPGAPQRHNSSKRFLQTRPPPSFGLLMDGACDEDDSADNSFNPLQSTVIANDYFSQDLRTPPRKSRSLSSLGSKIDDESLFPIRASTPESPSSVVSECQAPEIPVTPAELVLPFRESAASPLSPLKLRARGSICSPSGRRVSDGSPVYEQRSSSQTLDRFIPSWRPTTERRDSFLMSRAVGRLTPNEKSSRSSEFSPDPFSPGSRNLFRSSTQGQSPSVLLSRPSPRPGSSRMHSSSTSISPNARTRNNNALSPSDVEVTIPNGGSVAGVEDGFGGYLSSGTTAPLYSANFFVSKDAEHEAEIHERRLAVAFEVNQAGRQLELSSPIRQRSSGTEQFSSPLASPSRLSRWLHNENVRAPQSRAFWADGEWGDQNPVTLLDAPQLRDDFYTTLVAYCSTLDVMAVGLGSNVYIWSESRGVNEPKSLNVADAMHVVSLSFSSSNGGEAILAAAWADGKVTLWSPLEEEPRFDIMSRYPVSCISFAPVARKAKSARDAELTVDKENLLVGDEAGWIYYWSVEWPSAIQRDLFNFSGSMTLLAKIQCHTQQICGLAWSPSADHFASGGNDNSCFLFKTHDIVSRGRPVDAKSPYIAPGGVRTLVTEEVTHTLNFTHAKQTWSFKAAIKAIAFSPHYRSLLAIGGGSNDRQIHFVHTISGAVLARIDCCAQVTSLIWSTTRREICATFGFAQPDHNVRIAVFAWPSCEQLVAIRWQDEHRALWAIPFSGVPIDHERQEKWPSWHGVSIRKKRVSTITARDSKWAERARADGCIIVSTSDSSLKFHEVWPEARRRSSLEGVGDLGGSPILEGVFGQPLLLR